MDGGKNKWLVFYQAFEEWTAGLLLFTGLTLIMINVILRYVWGLPEALLDEFSLYLVVWGIFIGTSVALRTNHHIKVDVFYDITPLWMKRYISMFAHGTGITFCIFFSYFGILLVYDYYLTGQGSTDSQFPLWIVTAVMPISGVMLGVRFLQKFIFLFKDGGKAWRSAMEKGAKI
jgi:C4-dicarboxylate transporter DctQ subunit